MGTLILKLFDYIRTHRTIGVLSFLTLTALLVAVASRLEYKEDISDFLPLSGKHNTALNVFQHISGAEKIITIFQYRDTTNADPDMATQAIDDYVAKVTDADTTHCVRNVVSQIDIEQMAEISGFVYNNIPYFLTEADYRRIDSLLSQPDYVAKQLHQDKQMLMLPSGGILSENIQRDPLNLFTPVVKRLQTNSSELNYEIYDGYIFTPDMKKAIVMLDSPFGASETENNAKLVAMLRECADSTMASFSNIDIHITGGPVIAVGNANQIKADSILSVSCAIILISLLLFFTFRNARNLLLIVLSIGWGWIFGLGCLSLVHSNVSVIVIGISSVILGIAVNYPLHLIAHLSHATDKRSALKEIVSPLLVGNITTVGAFLALVPLQSVALRDLGLFSSFLLIGTIVFVLLYLPHVATAKKQHDNKTIARLGNIAIEKKPWIVWTVVVLTVVFGYYSLQTKFDANMSNINYMTQEQKADMTYFQNAMKTEGSKSKIYLITSASTLDSALDGSKDAQKMIDRLKAEKLVANSSGCSQFLPSHKEQTLRLRRWNDFTAKHGDAIASSLSTHAASEGFTRESFNDFLSMLNHPYQIEKSEFFQPLTSSVFSGYLSMDTTSGSYHVVDILSVDSKNISKVEEDLNNEGLFCFDVTGLNSAIANNLSNDFNYIGWACGCIVFFFLWISMGSIELAILSFIPMAVSWIWILGLMALFGIEFNIVNVILATFIFGQGDDYTIFMTEGSCHEYAYRKKILGSYKNSIIISALIMFIGIGTLIVAKHPALHSLAEVTIVGMLSVVLMAYLFPPLIFRWLVSKGGTYRMRPLSLRPLLVMALSATVFFAQLLSTYILGFILFVCGKPTKRKRQWLHRYVGCLFLFDLKHIPTVKFRIVNQSNENFSRPSVIVSNHQSMLDAAIFMALSPKCIPVSNSHVRSNRLIAPIYRWLGCISLSDNIDSDMEKIKLLVEDGYSIVFFPEGERNGKSSILRFHKGAFFIAEKLRLDITPVVIHGFNHVLPRNSIAVFSGQLTVDIHNRLITTDTVGVGYAELTKTVHQYFITAYSKLATEVESAAYYRDFIIDRYRYKGYEVMKSVKKGLKRHNNYARQPNPATDKVYIVEPGYGEFALLYALTHPHVLVTAIMADSDRADILRYSAEHIVENLQISSYAAYCQQSTKEDAIIIVDPTDELRQQYANQNNVIEI